MKLAIFTSGMIRTPTFCLEAKIDDSWEELKIKIKSASPEFFHIIKDLRYVDLNFSTEKLSYTVWKYFNRSKYRATPFGEFAAFSTLSCSGNENSIQIDKNIINHRFIDWSLKDVAITEYEERLIVNSTAYRVTQEVRYVTLNSGIFEMSSVSMFPELIAVFDLCKKSVPKHQVIALMMQMFKRGNDDITAFIDDMVKHQLLWTDRLPNITGPDYFQLINATKEIGQPEYIIAERRVKTGNIDLEALKNLPDLISFLGNDLPQAGNPDFETFKRDFLNKFGQREISLGVALDPELGVGYGALEQIQQEDGLVEMLKFRYKNNRSGLNIAYTSFHVFLLNQLAVGGHIYLNDFKHHNTDEGSLLPNSISVLYQLFEGSPVILNAGGSTAASLLGRFSFASQEIENSIKSIIQVEESANPDVIFFDIAYQAEKDIDNVNRRKNLYAFELPIFSWSCLNDPLSVDDILISVRESEVIIRSKKLEKRMIPRIASAYNYSRSDLSIYRFLCDLQHQGLRSNLSFNLEQFLPGLNHCPRIMFKNIIVSPAKWKLPAELVLAFKGESVMSAVTRLKNWLSEQKIDFKFKAGNKDTTLCFNPTSDNDLLYFIKFVLQQNTELFIVEALISKDSIVKDQEGSNYHAEFLVNCYHREKIYKPIVPENCYISQIKKIKSIELPGTNWLYFQIYCAEFRSNEILLEYIKPYLGRNAKGILRWFFIRYNDPKPHLRLRIQLKKGHNLNTLIKDLNLLLETKVAKGEISKIEIKTYVRETERYGINNMLLIERFFHLDSIYYFRLISMGMNSDELYCITLLYLINFLKKCFNLIERRIHFVKFMADSFAKEFDANHTTFKKINKEFKSIYGRLKSLETNGCSRQSMPQEKLLSKILDNC
jgi:thiopeptide-type bacteriocin biosynthesis protein